MSSNCVFFLFSKRFSLLWSSYGNAAFLCLVCEVRWIVLSTIHHWKPYFNNIIFKVFYILLVNITFTISFTICRHSSSFYCFIKTFFFPVLFWAIFIQFTPSVFLISSLHRLLDIFIFHNHQNIIAVPNVFIFHQCVIDSLSLQSFYSNYNIHHFSQLKILFTVLLTIWWILFWCFYRIDKQFYYENVAISKTTDTILIWKNPLYIF